MWQIASATPGAVSLAGRLLTGELLVMPDGREQSWGDYGFHKCFADGFRDAHSR
jgi:predicted aconitase with swiveling domain